MMKKLVKYLTSSKKGAKKHQVNKTRKEMEKEVAEGAKKAVKEYKRVFERLAEYDRT